MLAMVCAEVTETTNSDFKFTVTDNAGQETDITLRYVKTVAPAITYNNDADLWANTASFTLNIPDHMERRRYYSQCRRVPHGQNQPDMDRGNK